MIVRPPQLFRSLYPKAIWRMPVNEKVVYLTFDDGPTPVVTEDVLDLLEQYQAKATFFCIGKNVVEHPEIYQQIIAKEHAIGNHTQHHKNGFKTSTLGYVNDISACTDVVESNLFRPPYGRLTRGQYRAIKKHFKIIMWDVLSRDYNPNLSVDKCIKNVLDNVREGSIIVFHDSLKAHKNCIETLKAVLPELQKQGYQFRMLNPKAL